MSETLEIERSHLKEILKRFMAQTRMANGAIHLYDSGQEASAWSAFGSELKQSEDVIEEMEDEYDFIDELTDEVEDDFREEYEEATNAVNPSYTG